MLPRLVGGLDIKGEDDAYDFGSGAGFYVDATKEPYNKGYNMYTYITKELPETLFSNFDVLDSSRVSITGHSMGGHGALTLVCGLLILLLFYLDPTTNRCALVPEEPRQVQVLLRLRANRQPDQLPMGSKGLQWLLW